MKRADKSNINERLKTKFANRGRAAGAGISEDRYDEESCGPKFYGSVRVRMPSDSLSTAERQALNGPVVIRKEAKHE